MEPENQNESMESNTSPDMSGGVDNQVDQPDASTNASVNKIFATLGYIIPILFFVPLLDEKTKSDPFSRFHANQQLIVLILFVVVQFLHSSVLMVMSSLGYILMNIVSLALFALVIFGAFHAYKKQMKELPFVGHFRILK